MVDNKDRKLAKKYGWCTLASILAAIWAPTVLAYFGLTWFALGALLTGAFNVVFWALRRLDVLGYEVTLWFLKEKEDF